MRVEIFSSGKYYARRWYVRVRAVNGETLSISESYVSKGNAKRAAHKFYPHLPLHEVER